MNETDPAIEAAERAGFDLNLIDINLSMSPRERWRQHDMALDLLLQLQKARAIRDARLQSTPATAR